MVYTLIRFLPLVAQETILGECGFLNLIFLRKSIGRFLIEFEELDSFDAVLGLKDFNNSPEKVMV